MPCILALLVLAAASACGKKAPPRPPQAIAVPAAAISLSQTLDGDTVLLTWRLDEAPGAAAAAAGFYVYRSKKALSEADCPGCPVLFERVAALPREAAGSLDSAGPFAYQESLDPGYRYVYKVQSYLPGGAPGAESNTVEFRY